MNKNSVLFFSLTAIIMFTTACHRPEKSYTNHFLDTSAMDSSVKPGDNFYLFVNGAWIRQTPIPSSQSSVGGFEDLYNRTQDTLHMLLESLATEHNAIGSIEQKSGDFYASGMDSVAIEKRGYDPVKPYLQKIDNCKTSADVISYVTTLQTENKNILFAISVGADFKNSAMNMVFFSQGGLGLPDRDYYFKSDSASLSLIKAYQSYVQKLFSLTGDDSAAATKKCWYFMILRNKWQAAIKPTWRCGIRKAIITKCLWPKWTNKCP
jgi:putative endopeptidase